MGTYIQIHISYIPYTYNPYTSSNPSIISHAQSRRLVAIKSLAVLAALAAMRIAHRLAQALAKSDADCCLLTTTDTDTTTTTR